MRKVYKHKDLDVFGNIMGDEEKILETFLALKQENDSYELKKISGGYYVYLSSGRSDGAGKTRKISIYQGKITPSGTFVKVKHKRKSVLDAAATLNSARLPPIENQDDVPSNADAKIRQGSLKYEEKLLTALSMNGKISLHELSKMLGLSINATNWQLGRIEKRYDIRYLPEIDVTKFGYLQFLVTAKFLNGPPPIEEIRKAISKEPEVQLALLTKGDFDLMLHLLVQNVEDAKVLIIKVRDSLGAFDSIWNSMPMYETYGFIPVKDEFIDLLKHRGKLLDREYAVLKELNRDASIEFSQIDSKYGFDAGRANYSFHKLKDEGKIKRITITVRKLPVKYLGVIMSNMINRAKFKAVGREPVLRSIIRGTFNETNRYLAVYDTVSARAGGYHSFRSSRMTISTRRLANF